MEVSSLHSLPPLFLLLLLLFGAVIVVLQIGILGYAYERMGVSRTAAYMILLGSLLGSWVDIPVATLNSGQHVEWREVVVDHFLGTTHRVPIITEWPGTVLHVNLGGAIIPVALSIYLVAKNHIYGEALIGVCILSAVVHMLAKPVEHMGISVPIFIPPIVSAIVAVLLSRDYAAPLAYVSGCLGTLIGADLMNLRVMGQLGASMASIGGAGTFDGVFLTGILAVLLAGSPRQPQQPQSSELSPPYPEISGSSSRSPYER
jgi:uncharacterized membrane protein